MSDDPADLEFIARLRSAGVLDAAAAIGLSIEPTLLSLAQTVDHPYRSYRWSVGTDEKGGMVIHALPREEEVGWTPWERWSTGRAGPHRSQWTLYPRRAGHSRDPSWYQLADDSTDLRPRFHAEPHRPLERVLSLARIPEAAALLEPELYDRILGSMTRDAAACYRRYRWTVIPHLLAADLPVIYALPPMHRSDEWPWESWYTDDGARVIHHVHFTKPNARAVNRWRERDGAPQRPAEIFGIDWFWYDDPSMTPALAQGAATR